MEKELCGIMNKKLVSIFMAGILMFSGITGCSFDKGQEAEEGAKGSEAAPDTEGADSETDTNTDNSSNQIVIGDMEWSTGDITPYWTSNSVDSRVYRMISGYATTVQNSSGSWQYNDTVVTQVQKEEQKNGAKTWTFTIRNGLKWSNGETITAEDYVFAILLTYSNEWISALGAEKSLDSMAQYYVGASDYRNGLRDYFRGVHLIDKMTFSITVDARNLPNYYEKQLVCVAPEYRKGWLPEDVTVEETEDGARLSDNFTAEYIVETVNAFRFQPLVCCGPYQFESYDYDSGVYTLSKNPYFKGNYKGQTANVERVIYKYVSTDTALEQLRRGNIDVLAHCSDPDVVSNGLSLVLYGAFHDCMNSRLGYGMISFKCNQGPTQYAAVRQAVAYLLDRDSLIEKYLGGYSSTVNGPYSSMMWMVQNHEEKLQELNSYDYSPEYAAALLEADGWVYNEDGSDYSGEGIRYKKTDRRTYMPLVIEWCAPEASSVTPYLKEALIDNPAVAAVGMQIHVTEVSVNELEMYYYDNTEDNPYQMFSLACDFKGVYDFTEKFEPGGDLNLYALVDDGEKIIEPIFEDSEAASGGGSEAGSETGLEGASEAGSEESSEAASEGDSETDSEKASEVASEEEPPQIIYELACAMRETDESSDTAYFWRWFAFVKRWNQLLPEIPLYSNNYYDFYANRIEGYEMEGYNQDISDTILYLKVK